MMKKHTVPLALLALLALLLFGGWGNYYLLKRDASELTAAAGKLQRLLTAADWEEAGKQLKTTAVKWEKSKRYWPMLIHHQEMDRIEESVNRLKSYLDHQDSSMAEAELNNLIFYIEHIPEKEALSLQNIF